ncbi:TRAP-like protein [Rhizoclosmatium globosum]|uniref:Altered inheritance of mitochondria protein 24, mitochondrial n=1 Tax=Rhizoclosmatium globosum TaxID=329046 RepID=A0A1Y2B3Q8_9FUNG|nr:TRAP-like protein [Rhizoclosmatium globosum]|eukprot:ORY29469.1 TRAP-like protein [Rhizoclosmatium globosum]
MSRPAPPSLPIGYFAQWSVEHNRYCFVNEATKQIEWEVPTTPAYSDVEKAGSSVGTLVVAPAKTVLDTSGQFQGGSFEIQHRDTNTVIVMQLQNGEIHAKPGTLVSFTEGVSIRGTFHFNFKNIFTGDQTSFLHIQGPGQAIISSHGLGDIIVLPMNNSKWIADREAFLCYTDGITRDSKAQSLGKTLGSGPGLWVHHYSGTGHLFLETFGALMFKDLQPGENYFIHSNFVVAWNCQYTVEPIKTSSGGFFSKLATGDFWMCKYTGPGRVYFQSKSAAVFGEWISRYVGSG